MDSKYHKFWDQFTFCLEQRFGRGTNVIVNKKLEPSLKIVHFETARCVGHRKDQKVSMCSLNCLHHVLDDVKTTAIVITTTFSRSKSNHG